MLPVASTLLLVWTGPYNIIAVTLMLYSSAAPFKRGNYLFMKFKVIV